MYEFRSLVLLISWAALSPVNGTIWLSFGATAQTGASAMPTGARSGAAAASCTGAAPAMPTYASASAAAAVCKDAAGAMSTGATASMCKDAAGAMPPGAGATAARCKVAVGATPTGADAGLSRYLRHDVTTGMSTGACGAGQPSRSMGSGKPGDAVGTAGCFTYARYMGTVSDAEDKDASPPVLCDADEAADCGVHCGVPGAGCIFEDAMKKSRSSSSRPASMAADMTAGSNVGESTMVSGNALSSTATELTCPAGMSGNLVPKSAGSKWVVAKWGGEAGGGGPVRSMRPLIGAYGSNNPS